MSELPRRYSASHPAPRRIVLLALGSPPHAPPERILRESVPADRVREVLREESGRHPGRMVAAEWLGTLGWTRWLWCPARIETKENK